MIVLHKILQAVRLVYDSDFRFSFLDDYGFYDSMNDVEYLKRKFRIKMGRELNLESPQSFNEKLQWLKLYDRNPIYTTLVDKYSVKEYVSSIIGDEYIIPTLGVWDRFEDIDFDELPKQFVLKCTHDSGGLVICKDKELFDYKAARKKIKRSLKRNFYYVGREWPYKNVKPRIIAEKYMSGSSENGDLNDYKLMCFNGKVRCSFVCSERYSNQGMRVTFFDNNWNVLPFERHYPKSNEPIPKPENFELMMEMAEKLSENIPFVRTDFYEIDGKVYFGELTFYPGDGFEEFNPESFDFEIGKMIELPKKVGGGYS